jgi:hypothetical protein
MSSLTRGVNTDIKRQTFRVANFPSVVELVDMHQGLVWFSAVGTYIIPGPSNQELYGRPSMMIITMCYNISDHEFLLVLLSDFSRVSLIWIEEEGS